MKLNVIVVALDVAIEVKVIVVALEVVIEEQLLYLKSIHQLMSLLLSITVTIAATTLLLLLC